MFRSIFSVFIITLIVIGLLGCTGGGAATRKKSRAMWDMGDSCIRQGDLRGGLEHLQKAVELDSGNADLHHELGLIYRVFEEYQLSLRHFKKAVNIDPDFSDAWNNMGILYLMMGEWDPAIKCFKKALTNIVYRTPYMAYSNMGLAYYNKGDLQKAIECYNEAKRSNKTFGPAYFNLGRTYETMNRLEDAVDAYRKAIEFSDQYSKDKAHYYLGKLYLKLKMESEARDELTLAVKSYPKGFFAGEARLLMGKHGMKFAK